MNNRIREIRKASGLNQSDFSARLNLTQNYISLVESGHRDLSDRSIKDICREFSVNEEWLRTGNGEMYLPQDDETAAILSDILEDPTPEFYQMCLALAKAYQELDANGKRIINEQAREMAKRILKDQD